MKMKFKRYNKNICITYSNNAEIEEQRRRKHIENKIQNMTMEVDGEAYGENYYWK